MRVGCDKAPGLTLLETLLAISMLAMILAALHVALSSGVSAYRRCRDGSERDTTAHSAIRLVSEDLLRLTAQTSGQAAPVLLVDPAAGGAGGCLLRLRTHARAAPGARAMLVDYFFMPSGLEGGSLVRRSEPLAGPGSAGEGRIPPGGPGDSQVRYEIVATALRAVRFRCFDGQGWSDRWNSARQSAPPRLIEMSLEFAAPADAGATYARALPVVVEAPLIPWRAQEARP